MRGGSVPHALSWGRREIMPTYRAYLINEDNRVASYKPIEADTDAEALQAARQFVNGCDVEVWHLDRRIGRLGKGNG
jgi:cytolysin (calcineurin-like family phosphatase)